MSQERRKRQEKRQQKEDPLPRRLPRTIIIAVIIAAALGVAVYLGVHKRNSRYDAFARCTAERGARMYGAFWCPHCEEQKELFGSSFQDVNYIECGVKGNTRAQSQVCKDAGIKNYPTWEFADQSRIAAKESFEFLSAKTGCPLP